MPGSKGKFKCVGENQNDLSLPNLDEISLAQMAFDPNSKCLKQEFVEFLISNGLLSSGPICEQHGISTVIRKRNDIDDGVVYRCPMYKKDKCSSSNISIRRFSFFENSKMHIGDVMHLILKYIQNDTLVDIGEATGLSKSSVIRTIDFLRDVPTQCVQMYYAGFYRKSVFQIDESVFGRKRKYHRGNNRGAVQIWVFGILDVLAKDLILYVVENRKKSTLLNLIKMHCAPGSWIMHDEWKPYEKLHLEGYIHHSVNHSKRFTVPMIDENNGELVIVHTNEIEGEWMHAKEYLRHRFGVSRERFHQYLPEIVFRRVNRSTEKRREEFWNMFKKLYPLSEPPKKHYANGLNPTTVMEIRRDMNFSYENPTISSGFEKYEHMQLVALSDIPELNQSTFNLEEFEDADGPEYFEFEEDDEGFEIKEFRIAIAPLSKTELESYGIFE